MSKITGESWTVGGESIMSATEVRARQEEAKRKAGEVAHKASMTTTWGISPSSFTPTVPFGGLGVTSITSPSTGSYTINFGEESEASGLVLTQITEAFLATLTSDEIVELGMKVTNELTRREETNNEAS